MFHIEKKQTEISNIHTLNQMILSHMPKGGACFVYDCLSMDSFQEKSRKELKDNNYTKYSRGLSELHERALLVEIYQNNIDQANFPHSLLYEHWLFFQSVNSYL